MLNDSDTCDDETIAAPQHRPRSVRCMATTIYVCVCVCRKVSRGFFTSLSSGDKSNFGCCRSTSSCRGSFISFMYVRYRHFALHPHHCSTLQVQETIEVAILWSKIFFEHMCTRTYSAHAPDRYFIVVFFRVFITINYPKQRKGNTFEAMMSQRQMGKFRENYFR